MQFTGPYAVLHYSFTRSPVHGQILGVWLKNSNFPRKPVVMHKKNLLIRPVLGMNAAGFLRPFRRPGAQGGDYVSDTIGNK